MKVNTQTTKIPDSVADLVTPVSIYLKIRDRYPNTLLLESSDYHGAQNSMSYICFDEIATFEAKNGETSTTLPSEAKKTVKITKENDLATQLNDFINGFDVPETKEKGVVNGLWGYSAYDAVQYFESIKFGKKTGSENDIPEIRYAFHRYVIAINHFYNQITLVENLLQGEESRSEKIIELLKTRNISAFQFKTEGEETSNISDEEYLEMVEQGKKHCYRGDVFQIVLSRRFNQKFSGDEFNVYRALRRINPSPYLFFFDFGAYKIFGSSPESQLIVNNNTAHINPIAGTFRRTGDDEKDFQLAEKLMNDKKENAEHVMLVDLGRNDIGKVSKFGSVHLPEFMQQY